MRRIDLMLILLLAPTLCSALESDARQPIQVQADSVELDNRQGISHYDGHVVVDQGSLHMEADHLEIRRGPSGPDLIEATGKPVRVRQRPDGAGEDIEGSAARVEYHAVTGRLQLEGDALIVRGRDRFSGENIVYDTRAGVVKAGGTRGKNKGDGRVHAIIVPRTAPDKNTKGEPSK